MLVDSPPVMPVADSQILGAICDITILVIKAQKATRKPSQMSCETLAAVGSHLLGVVVNDVPQRKGRYGSYHKYGYYSYGYYYDSSYYGTKKSKEMIESTEKSYT